MGAAILENIIVTRSEDSTLFREISWFAWLIKAHKSQARLAGPPGPAGPRGPPLAGNDVCSQIVSVGVVCGAPLYRGPHDFACKNSWVKRGRSGGRLWLAGPRAF